MRLVEATGLAEPRQFCKWVKVMRVLWVSDSPDTPSGFGNVTHFVCEGLARRGHNVSIIGWQTKQLHDWNGCKVYPSLGRLGSDAVFPFLIRNRPEVVIALADVWWLPYFSSPHVRRQMELTDTPWVLYFPIDGDMEGERLPASWTQLLREVDVPVAMSRYGQRIVRQNGLSCEYIPHGVDLNVFCPPSDRHEAKARIGASGKFVILSDSRNQPRKMLPRLLDVFAKFVARRPDSLLHLHTDPDDEFTKSGVYSYDVRADLLHLGIESKVTFTPGLTMKRGGGVPLKDLAAYYQAADVHLLASSGEGFGLPTLQAAAAGAVPMAGAYSASKELVEGHGETIEISEWSENEFAIRRGLIDVEDSVQKLEKLCDDRSLLAERSAASRRFAMSYSWDEIVNQWDSLLRSITNRPQRTLRTARVTALPQGLRSFVDPQIDGVSVKVNVVERPFGHLESGFRGDIRGHISDVRIPAIQKACEVDSVRVLRKPAYLAVSPGDEVIFDRLEYMFPILSGWTPGPGPASQQLSENIRAVPWEDFRSLRYELAQSVLLLNVSGRFSDDTLIDAALYGVVCVGTAKSEVLRTLWEELAAEDELDAVRLGRMLLTNPARLRKMAARARAACQARYAPSEKDAALWLRQLHHAQSHPLEAA